MKKFGNSLARLALRLLFMFSIFFVSYAVFVMVVVKRPPTAQTFLLENHPERKSDFRQSNFGLQEQENPHLSVIILSSMPRSGSTLLGELLKTKYDNVVYYFEPDQYIENNDCLKDDKCTDEFFKNLLKCTENKDFSTWFKNKNFFFQFYDQEAEKCAKDRKGYKSCVSSIDLLEDCKKTPLLIVKNIRIRLEAMRNLLSDNELNLRIVHLIRDPRGSLNSIKKFRWNIPEETRCEGQLQDLIEYDVLKTLYPDKVTNITYEKLCLSPWKAAEDLFGFLFRNKTLPPRTQAYLQQHYFPKKEKQGVMSTIKDAKSHVDSWRYKINQSHLKFIEEEKSCKSVIIMMGHTLFGSKSAAMNKSISVFESTG